jgi:hypothetical protein
MKKKSKKNKNKEETGEIRERRRMTEERGIGSK